MRAIVIERQGAPVAPNVRLVDDYADPTPSAGEVVVETEAAALNHLDLWVGRGLPGIDLTYPRVSGSDGCGRVVAVGPGVDGSWVGRRVLLNAAIPQPEPPLPGVAPAPPDILMIGEHVDGCMAERFLAPASNLLDVGDVDPIAAAAFGLTHLTAWRMLVTRARLRAGQTVLVTGVGGGVALALLAIAKHFGCTVIVTSRHQAKLDRACELGADHGVLDVGADWSRQVRALTGKRGVDIVADSVGKAVHMSCVKSLARRGTIVTCGCTSGHDATTDLARIFWNQLAIVGSTMGDMIEFREAVSLLISGRIAPTVDSVHPPIDAKVAYGRLESTEQFGKVVVDWRR